MVKRELLDVLPPDDPGAVGSRRDIGRLNRLMGHARILRRLLEPVTGETGPRRLVELGAGDGTLMLRLAQMLSHRWEKVELVLVDRHDVVHHRTRAAFEALGWSVETAGADVFDWLNDADEPANAMIANLFLHHFEADKLEELLRLAASRTRVFAACEPRRAGLPQLLSRFAGLIGCNAVTRHDIVASVRAGFAGAELSALWPAHASWSLQEDSAGLFSHSFLARARHGPGQAAVTSGA